MSTIDVPLTTPGTDRAALNSVDRLLRDREGQLAAIDGARDLAGLARAMLITIAAGAAMFGAAAGAYRGGVQIAYAALKLPLVVLLTAAVCAPALTALNAALDRRHDVRRDLALVLSSLALGCLVLSAEAPVVLLAVTLGAGYHAIALLLFAGCVLAGLFAVSLLARGIFRERQGAIAASAGLLLVFALVGSQMSWTLRPWLGRPAKPIVFLRSIEGGLLDSVRTAVDSARGVYRRESEYDGYPSSALPEPTRGNVEIEDIGFPAPPATGDEGEWL